VEPGWRPGDFDAEQVDEAMMAAARLREHLRTGGRVEPIATGLRLEPDEHAYADELMEYARFYGDDTFVQERPGSYLSPTAVVGSLVRNRVNRESAEPSWRGVHTTRVAITDRRLLISLEGAWLALPYPIIAEFLPHIADLTLVLTLFGEVPLRLRAPNLPERTVLLATLLFPTRDPATLPGLEAFA
jgi:hypothetical protein